MKRTSLRSGPRESNAGDDFHILWAASQAIQLLNPRSGLRRIFVEKLSPTDESPVETKDDLFLGADVAEYFGGDDFCSAARVVVAQLKYSTRHSTRAWTVSRLAQLNRGASVIQRLAAIFKGFANIHARPDVTQKLKIRLVSNQPAADSLQVALDEAQRLLKNQSLTPPTLFAQLKPAQRKAITTLSKQAGLDESEFLDFLRVFDLSGCGEASRHRRRSDLLKQLAPQVSNDPATMLRSLCDLIRSEALPERTDSAGLTEHDVLAALNVPIKENLFPAPAHFQTVTYLIETPDAVDLAKTIVSSKQGRKILAHGNAGAGKTTTVQHVAQQLPPGSIVLTYDCFGGGDYKVPGSQRHTQSRAFLQLTNEMAVHCGTPFLLRPAHETADLQRDFRRALDVASRIVALDHGGLLVIFIDAADNAVLAAEGERDCFVPIFWQIPFPENCRLVMTCRTHRRASLGATQEVVEYALRGFDETASAAHLRTLYTNANVEACERFHRLTGGNPRMQAYLLEHARDEALPLTQLFVGKRKTLEDLFHDLLESAVSHSPARVNSQELLADLICLMRPAPPAMLADVHDLTPEKALAFCHSLEPGVHLEDGAVWFRDEDFETFLREQLKPEEIKAAHARLGRWLLQAPNATPYAARFVAEHLFKAELHEELIQLALDGPAPEAVRDEIGRLQVRRKRLELATQAACALGNDRNAIRLVMLAAEAARSNGAVAALVRANIELALQCGNANSARRFYLQEREYGWPGAAHLRLAAIFARSETERDRAEDHLAIGKAWIRRKLSPAERENQHWQIQVEDIAHEAEAVFWLSGPERAFQHLNRWKPKNAVLIAATQLLRSLADRVPLAELERILKQLKLPALAKAVLLATLWGKGHQPNLVFANDIARRIERLLRAGRTLPDLDQERWRVNAWAIPFCESLAAAGVAAERVLYIARTLGPTKVPSAPHHAIDALYHEMPVRGACLIAAMEGRSLTVQQLRLEANPKRKGNGRYDPREESNWREFEETIGILLSVHQARVQTIIGNPLLAEMEQRLASDLHGHRFTATYPVRLQFLFRPWAERACETLLRCGGTASDMLECIADEAESVLQGGAPSCWTALAERIIQQEAYQPLAYRLLERAAHYVMERPFPARDRWEQLLTCAVIVSRFDEALCRDFYQRALIAAEGIDDDLIPLLTLYCRLAKHLPQGESRSTRQHTMARLARLVETHKDYVSETSSQLWGEMLSSATSLSPPDGLALCSRWDDENFFDIKEGIVPTVQAAAQARFLSPLESLALLRLTGEGHDISADVLPLLEQLRNEGAPARPQLSHAAATISVWVRRDAPLSSRKRAAARILGWFEQHGLWGLPGLAELRCPFGGAAYL